MTLKMQENFLGGFSIVSREERNVFSIFGHNHDAGRKMIFESFILHSEEGRNIFQICVFVCISFDCNLAIESLQLFSRCFLAHSIYACVCCRNFDFLLIHTS